MQETLERCRLGAEKQLAMAVEPDDGR